MDADERALNYMQNRLGPEARAAFEAEMARSPDLRAEVTALRAAAADLGRRAPPPGAKAAGWAKLSAAIEAERLPQPANRNRRVSLSALQAAGLMAASVALWHFVAQPLLPRIGGDAGFVPASESAPLPALRVAFAPDAPMAEVTALLQQTGAQVVAGPGALGLYTLSFADQAALNAAAARLEARRDLTATVARP